MGNYNFFGWKGLRFWTVLLLGLVIWAPMAAGLTADDQGKVTAWANSGDVDAIVAFLEAKPDLLSEVLDLAGDANPDIIVALAVAVCEQMPDMAPSVVNQLAEQHPEIADQVAAAVSNVLADARGGVDNPGDPHDDGEPDNVVGGYPQGE